MQAAKKLSFREAGQQKYHGCVRSLHPLMAKPFFLDGPRERPKLRTEAPSRNQCRDKRGEGDPGTKGPKRGAPERVVPGRASSSLLSVAARCNTLSQVPQIVNDGVTIARAISLQA